MSWAKGVDLEENSPEAAVHRFGDKPVPLIHGKSGSLIPYTDSIRLKEILVGSAELWLIDGAGHAETMHNSDDEARLQNASRSEMLVTTAAGRGICASPVVALFEVYCRWKKEGVDDM